MEKCIFLENDGKCEKKTGYGCYCKKHKRNHLIGQENEIIVQHFTFKETDYLRDDLKEYFNNLIAKSEKKSNSTEFVKYHITEKYNYSLVCTSRRAKLLNEMLPSEESIIHFHNMCMC